MTEGISFALCIAAIVVASVGLSYVMGWLLGKVLKAPQPTLPMEKGWPTCPTCGQPRSLEDVREEVLAHDFGEEEKDKR